MSGSSAKYTHFYAINADKVALVTERRMLSVPANSGECQNMDTPNTSSAFVAAGHAADAAAAAAF